MKSKKKSISLKAYLWLCFSTFAIIIMVLLWILQTLFLGAFYNSMKLNELEKAGKLIKEQYSLRDEDFYKYWFEHSFNSGIFAQLVSEDGEVLRNFYNVPGTDSRQDEASAEDGPVYSPPNREDAHRKFPGSAVRGFNPADFENLIERVNSSSRGDISYVVKAEETRASFAIYGTCIGTIDDEKIYLTLMSPLERTDTTRKVLQTQLIIASVVAIILALAVAYFIARRLSMPIENINKGARALADGDYTVSFEEGTYREIDELSQTLNYATGELSKTEELRRDLISNVSHDLRTPLTIIKSYAELIRDISGTNDEKRTRHTEIIIEETNNLSLLVNDMLDLSRIQSGTMPMNICVFNLSQLVRLTVKRFDYYRENHGISFEEDYSCDAFVRGDERRIEQVVYNLVANAVNYTGDDRRIRIAVTEAGNKVRFSAKDTGCGIPEDEIDLVWDKYYKASETYAREKIGTGIGLSIVKTTLLAHGADFGVISNKDSGSEFWFELEKTEQ